MTLRPGDAGEDRSDIPTAYEKSSSEAAPAGVCRALSGRMLHFGFITDSKGAGPLACHVSAAAGKDIPGLRRNQPGCLPEGPPDRSGKAPTHHYRSLTGRSELHHRFRDRSD